MRPRVSGTAGLPMNRASRGSKRAGSCPCCAAFFCFPRSYRESTDLFHWNRKSPLQVALSPVRRAGPAKGDPLYHLDHFCLARLETRVFADSRGLRSVTLIGNFTQIPSKIFQPGARVSAVYRPGAKAQLLRRVVAVASHVVLGELGIQRKEVIHGRRSSEQICSMAQLRRFNDHRVIELEDVDDCSSGPAAGSRPGHSPDAR
jgi:hypothetical protein